LNKDAILAIIWAAVGAILASFGGFMGEVLNIFMQNKRERTYIIISLDDELTEIIDIISKFSETFENSGNANKKYIVDLSNSMSSFALHKNKLYLFKNYTLRRRITSFYKSLNNIISEDGSKVGTLAQTAEAKAEQREIVKKFKDIVTTANSIKDSLTDKKTIIHTK